MDIPEAKENYEKIKAVYEPQGIRVFPVSAATNTGLNALIAHVAEALRDYPENITFEEDYEEYVEPQMDTEPFTVSKEDDHYFLVEGVGVEKMIGYTAIDTEKGFAFFQKYLRDRGIISALEEKGIQEGDTVRIYFMEFDYYK
jgi:GTP-binding protein